MPKKNKNRVLDWKNYPEKKWIYEGDIEDPNYLKDRSELFSSSGDDLAPFNGWWCFVPNKIHKLKYNTKYYKKKT